MASSETCYKDVTVADLFIYLYTIIIIEII